jgi:organic radical activating enzyme
VGATIEQESFFAKVKSPLLTFLWLEITGVCNLKCVHCYADSGPAGQQDSVGTARWITLLHEAAQLGVRAVQFIGGEPLVHRDITLLLTETRALGIHPEIYSNLTHVRESLWPIFKEQRVSLATSFYSRHPKVHDEITQQTGSWVRTVSNVKRAVEYSLPLRVGIIDIRADQDLEETEKYLQNLGVSRIRIDRSRGVGRAATPVPGPCSADELCGACTGAKLAIGPDGESHPCVFARWLNVGNVCDKSLAAVAASPELARARHLLDAAFADRQIRMNPCDPDCVPNCAPDCTPSCSPNNCGPCPPFQDCGPFCDPNFCEPSVPNCWLTDKGD